MIILYASSLLRAFCKCVKNKRVFLEDVMLNPCEVSHLELIVNYQYILQDPSIETNSKSILLYVKKKKIPCICQTTRWALILILA